MDLVDIARWQFGITTVYHLLFVPITIGLSGLIAAYETAWVRTRNEHWLRLTKFFGRLFLINFAMGVVTGIVQEFQFGMNWSDYSRFVGDVFGAPLAVEGLLAFFLESTFLGLWIFGWDRLSPRLHAACIWLVHIGTLLSAYFILAANSWMQHPVGYRYNPRTGRAELHDFAAVLFNKVQLVTFPHTVIAAYMTGAAFALAVAFWHLEGTQEKFALKVPGLLSFLATGSTDGTVQGIDQLRARYEKSYGQDPGATYYSPSGYTPLIPLTYWTFRLMIGLGVLAAAVAAAMLWVTRRGRMVSHRAWFWAAAALPLLPLLANTAGWVFTEMGRQPWAVFGLMTTARAVSPGVSVTEAFISLVALTALYGALAVVEVRLLLRYAGRGADPLPVADEAGREGPDRPLAFSY